MSRTKSILVERNCLRAELQRKSATKNGQMR